MAAAFGPAGPSAGPSPASNVGGPGSVRRYTVAMVCDFFYPRLGGVEMHIWSLSQCLLAMGVKVIVITNAHGNRRGVRYMTNGLKVYYVPMTPFADQASFPTFVAFFPLFRQIVLRERVNIVHGHQATSTLMHEAILAGRTMGLKCVYTDHSLWGFADAASINVNKLLKFTLSDVDHAIAVSHTCRENLVLRASLAPATVSAIPNAVDPMRFVPDPSARRPAHTINIVVISRLVYRKGIDLLVHVIPPMCKNFRNVHFIIGGDGPKRLLLEEMREKHQLHERVELLGAVPHAKVRDVLVRGHIFLNCSLTESFCIAILEAACCGLYVVSTRVGGVPEVLKDHMISLAEPNADALVAALTNALQQVRHVDPREMHNTVAEMYSWKDVAERTMLVYDNMIEQPTPSLLERLQRYYGAGPIFGAICCFISTVLYLLWVVLCWLSPADNVEIAPDFPYRLYAEHQEKLHPQFSPIRRRKRPADRKTPPN